MENIISQNNGKVRTVVRLLSGPKERKYLGRYVVEGTRMVREIPDRDLDSIFMTQTYCDKIMKEDARIRNLIEKAVLRSRCYIVTEPILRKMSDTKHPQGIIATVYTKNYSVEEGKRIDILGLMSQVNMVIGKIQHMIGGGFIYLDVEKTSDSLNPALRPYEKLVQLYNMKAGYVPFNERHSPTDGKDYIMMIKSI